MKFIKRAALTILSLAAAGILFRGWIYRCLITYKSIGLRPNYSATDTQLIDYINTSAGKQPQSDVEQIIKLALSITSDQLHFTAAKNDNDPNKLIASRSVHCVGYASFFAASCNYLFAKHNLADSWRAQPQVGQLYFLGTNIHKYTNTPFFKDHDFVIIENQKTGQVYAVDPTVSDYLHIEFVTYIPQQTTPNNPRAND